jgi:hypothetical protein
MKTLNIDIPEGYEIDQENSDLTKGFVAFKKIKYNFPKSWEDLKSLTGFFVSETCEIEREVDAKTYITNKNLFANREQADASLALAQLSQLREVYRQGWKPDWNHEKTTKWCINFHKDKVIVDVWYTTHKFLSFQYKEIAQEFLDNFGVLILQARPLMS